MRTAALGESAGGAGCGVRILFALVAWMAPLHAWALHQVDPGESPRLEDGDGLLVVAIDASSPVSSAKFRKSGTLFTGDVLARVPAGRTLQLYVVPAGRYQWTEVTLVDTWSWHSSLKLDDDPEYGFEVKPGQITYAGDLVLRPMGWFRSGIRVSNRALPVIDWLQQKFPALYERYRLVYSGHYPDPFPEFYRKERAGAPALPDPDAAAKPPAAGELALPPKLLWAADHIETVALSPDGTLVAEIVREEDGTSWLQLIDMGAGSSQGLVKSAHGIGGVQWKDERTLLATVPALQGEQLHAFLIGDRAGDVRKVQHLDGPSGGRVVDLLPESPGQILYGARIRQGTLVVHRLDVTSEKGMRSFSSLSAAGRLNKGVEDDVAWYADGHGTLRAALATKDGATVLMHGANGQFRQVLRIEADDEGLTPLKLSYDGDVVYALSDEGRMQRDLVVYDPAQGKVTETLYSKPGVDVVSALFDDRRQPIGVRYYESGRLVSQYFDGRDSRIEAMLQAAFPKRSVAIVDRNRAADRMLLWVDGSDKPPQLYYFDLARHEAQLLDEAFPGLQKRTFVPTQLLQLRNAQSMPLDAFVTIPEGSDKRPLVVMPHGGPIGVRDALHFDREVQFLASLGYAVLQVNFRGSDGYGRAFRDAGRYQYGRGIEDDIDLALQAALERFPLDAERMCIVGASYGGYSALYSAIRWPGRFRCVVSIAGVSDRALFFTASDSGGTRQGRESLERWIGNPNTEMDKLVATSPLYQYRRLETPVMLVHGGKDARVDFEHTRRLVRMLNLAGRPPVLLAFPDAGHGLDEVKDLDVEWTGIAGFLRRYLERPAAGAPVAAGAAVHGSGDAAPAG